MLISRLGRDLVLYSRQELCHPLKTCFRSQKTPQKCSHSVRLPSSLKIVSYQMIICRFLLVCFSDKGKCIVKCRWGQLCCRSCQLRFVSASGIDMGKYSLEVLGSTLRNLLLELPGPLVTFDLAPSFYAALGT